MTFTIGMKVISTDHGVLFPEYRNRAGVVVGYSCGLVSVLLDGQSGSLTFQTAYLRPFDPEEQVKWEEKRRQEEEQRLDQERRMNHAMKYL